MQKVDLCGVDTSALPVLSHDTMMKLIDQAQSGDTLARDALVEGNLRLVLSVIQRFSHRGECGDDLFQVGCVGLLKSIDNFDTSLGVRFSTYAVPMIIGEIRRYLRDNNALRVSRSLRDLAYKALQVRERLTRERGEEPPISEIAKTLEVSPEEISASLDAIADPVSLFEPIFTDGGDELLLMDQISEKENGEERWVENIGISQALSKLTSREQRILFMRFFDGRTQMEVASEIGISQAQVSRLEKGALHSLRKQV